MAFRFRLDKPIQKEVRRIGAEQIERALGKLAAGVEAPAEIHEIRKSLKRVRALLRLGREGLGQKVFRSENERFRIIAGRLSSVRDDHVVIETLLNLEAETSRNGIRDALHRIRRALLEGRPENDGTALNLDPATLAHIQIELRLALKSFRNLKFSYRSTAPLVAGLVRIYRRARLTMATAYARGRDEDFHAWRKMVQAHWRHMALLNRLWPELFAARVAAARELSEMLGNDHDLALLRDRVAALGENILPDSEKDAVLTFIRARQNLLRRSAKPRGDMLFAASPKAHGRWIEALWEAAVAKGKVDLDAAKWGDGQPESSKKPAFSRN